MLFFYLHTHAKIYIILKNVENILKYCNAIAIGGFDGMHNGHQKLFSELGNDGCIVVIETGYANLTPKKSVKNFRELTFVN